MADSGDAGMSRLSNGLSDDTSTERKQIEFYERGRIEMRDEIVAIIIQCLDVDHSLTKLVSVIEDLD